MRQRDAVDWDRLADHLGGALAGTPEGAEVDRLVATDPSWSQAAAELAGALDAVAADLRALPPVPALPDDVAARLDTALHAVNPVAGAEPAGAEPAGAEPLPTDEVESPVPGQRAAAPALDDTAGSRRPRSRRAGSRRPAGADRPGGGGRPRRRAVRWGAGLALAAGLVAFAAVGLTNWLPDNPSVIAGGGEDDSGAEGEAAGPAQAPRSSQPLAESAGEPAIVATGTEYLQPSVGAAEPELPAERDNGSGTPGLGTNSGEQPMAEPPESTTGTDRVPDVVPPTLAWMWVDPAAREQCLDQIRAALGPPPVRVETVDFAQYEGQDAIVLWATTADGTRVVWVSGAQCGTAGAGPDGIFQDQLS